MSLSNAELDRRAEEMATKEGWDKEWIERVHLESLTKQQGEVGHPALWGSGIHGGSLPGEARHPYRTYRST